MASIRWAELPYKISDTSTKLHLSPTILFRLLELVASQIFGVLFYTFRLNLSELLERPVPIIVQLVFNYLLFKLIAALVNKFEITSLPTFTDSHHERFVKALILPYAGIIVSSAIALITFVVTSSYQIMGLSFYWWSLAYGYAALVTFSISVEQFASVTSYKKAISHFHVLGSIVFFSATLLILAIFYSFHW